MYKYIRIIGIVVAVYVGVYGIISFNGRFEPAATGLNGVKWYGWAPMGFVNELKWNRGLMYFFLPVYLLDIRFWHTEEKQFSGDYPVNYLTKEQLLELYQKSKSQESTR